MDYIATLRAILRASSEVSTLMSMTRRRRAWERWKVIAKKIGAFQSRVILTLFYIFIVPVFALIVKLFKDPLHLRSREGESYWLERKTPHPDESTARRQF